MPESKKRKRDITLFLVIATLYVTNYNVFIKGKKKKTFYSETKTGFHTIFFRGCLCQKSGISAQSQYAYMDKYF